MNRTDRVYIALREKPNLSQSIRLIHWMKERGFERVSPDTPYFRLPEGWTVSNSRSLHQHLITDIHDASGVIRLSVNRFQDNESANFTVIVK